MKIRRSLALAAATAAITPAVLLAAPAAFATESPATTAAGAADTEAPSNTEDQPNADEQPNADDPSNGDDQTEEKGNPSQDADDTTTPGTDGQSDDTGEKSDNPENGSGSKDDEGTTPTDTESATPTPSPSASPSETPGPQVCNDTDDYKQDKNLHTSLSGLPSKIVAGSGFHNFKLNVNNSGDNAYKRVDLGVFAAQVNEKTYEVTSGYLTLQFKDPATGTWQNISLDENDEGAGYLGYTDVQAKESFSIDLRLSIDSKAPAGLGFAISIGMYADDKGNCVYSSDDDFYQFDVLAAGSKQANPGDAKPQGGRKSLPVKPAGDNEIVPQGHLAETGSSSALPAIALAGGAAVAVGAGAVFVVRRRKAGSGVASA
ncbi:LAETG motif-containing sortase-dependent surface protein [Streptomyces cyslabdanicus]|uniref:LAETG motif-containing sortase-dependent surface protein n=1 Tax=Streptomyces cyslabdanicus TaxID=1470456 RepID=UPI004043A389